MNPIEDRHAARVEALARDIRALAGKLKRRLREQGSGIQATARQAYEQGFNVTLAIDAMMDMRPGAHDYSVRTVFPRLGETGSTRDVIDLLKGNG